MKLGVLFIGHGTRLEAGISEFEAFVHSIMKRIVNNNNRNDVWFGSCFLELQEPTIVQGIDAAVLNGCDLVVAVPVFLFSAKHIKIDIPRLLDFAHYQYSDLSIIQTPPFGPDESLVDACTYRLMESGWTPSAERSSIVLVGRGGYDKEVHVQFETLAQRITKRQKVDSTSVKQVFLAGGKQNIDEVLAGCLQEGFQDVYVVPVLLFRGMLTKELGHAVRSWSQQTIWNGMSVVLVSHLQGHFALVEQLTRRVTEVIETMHVVQ